MSFVGCESLKQITTSNSLSRIGYSVNEKSERIHFVFESSHFFLQFTIQHIPRNSHSNEIFCYVPKDLENHRMECY